MPFAFTSHFYPILDVDLSASRGYAPDDLLNVWLDAGVRDVQLRAKTLGSGEFLRLADDVAARCRSAGTRFIVNDRADVALMAGADGVHVGQDDLPASAVRHIVGARAIVGLSTHNDAQMRAACTTPVNYVAIGPVFSTHTKASGNPAVGLAGVAEASALARDAGLPLVAIGGITLATAPQVLAAGADAVAVISDLLVGDPAARVREFLDALK